MKKYSQAERLVAGTQLTKAEWAAVGLKQGWLTKAQSEKTANIDIKPSHEGRFTDYCGGEVTEACIRKGLASKDPHVREMANFARNFR